VRSLTGAVALLILTVTVQATEMASANYGIAWDVADSGGGLMASPGYVLTDSVGQPSAIGFSSSENYFLKAGFQAPPDYDGDVVRDFMDNCSMNHNSNQRDTDSDGIGNVCDPDINNDCSVDFLDLVFYKANFLQAGDLDTDNNGDGITDFLDLLVVRDHFFASPGPSANGCN